MGQFKNLKELKDKLMQEKTLKLKIKVVANSKIDSFDFEYEPIKIKIKEKAIDGKANQGIIEFISKSLEISKNKVNILVGEKSTIKLLEIKY